MLLFCDGFENFDVLDLWRKWGFCGYTKTVTASTGEYTSPNIKIVTGDDDSVTPSQPMARHQRALSVNGQVILGTPIPKSRTLFTGFAFRSRYTQKVRLRFHSAFPYPRTLSTPGSVALPSYYAEWYGEYNPAAGKNWTVAVCDINIKSDRIDCEWTFQDASLPKRFTQVLSNTNLLSGSWYYFQSGFSILGADPNNPQGWVENRIGNRPNKANRLENILTSVSNGRNSFYVNAVSLSVQTEAGKLAYFDDFYIANDEGNTNNTFLGNISIRNVIPVAEGTINSAEPHGGNTMYRSEHVGCGDDGFVRTNIHAPSVPFVTGDPLAVGVDPRSSHLRLLEEDDCQLIRFSHTNYAGSEPNIVAAVITTMARSASVVGTPGQLLPTVRLGDGTIVYGRRMHYSPLPVMPVMGDLSMTPDYAYPLTYVEGTSYHIDIISGRFFAYDASHYNFQCIQSFIEPTDSNATLWNATAINNSEYGFTLKAWDGNMSDLSNVASRLNITFDDTIVDGLFFDEYTSRHIEVSLYETFGIDISSTYADWGASVSEEFVTFDGSEPARGFLCFCEDHLYSKDEFRMEYLAVDERIDFTTSVDTSWHFGVYETLCVSPWNTGWYCEQVNSIHTSVDATVSAVASLIEETFQIDSSDIWDNHFSLTEDIFIDVTYIFEGHETAEEYLGLESYSGNGLGMYISDGVVFVEENHSAWWVELFSSGAGFLDDTRTQQWRHIWFMGVIIQSWQIDPIEQVGATDGDRVGDLDPEIFG